VNRERRHALIVVERDDVGVLLTESLSRLGYGVTHAAFGQEALERLGEVRPGLMLIDIHLRDGSALDVLATARGSNPAPGVVMLLGEADGALVGECLERGALDYLMAPFEASGLERDLGRVARWCRGVARGPGRERFTEATLDALITVQEAKNPFVAGHSLRVASVSAAVAAQVGLPAPEVDRIRRAGRLHDLGMIGVRERVWDKPTQLTEDEYQQVKQHTVIGARILEPLTHLGPVIDYVQSHHERWDGKGYPDELAGHDIPLGGRIIHAAEVFDALTTRRPYQDHISPEAALTRMQELARTGLDPMVVEAFAEAIAASHTLPLGRDDVVRTPVATPRMTHRPRGDEA